MSSVASRFTVRRCNSTPDASSLSQSSIDLNLSYRSDLDIAAQLRTVSKEKRENKKAWIEEQRTAFESLHRDERTHKLAVRHLLVEAAVYQNRQQSCALNAYIRKVSSVGPGNRSCKVPSATLKVLFEDMDIIHRRYGSNGVLQSVAKLPLWQV
jgi:hypothetical protein